MKRKSPIRHIVHTHKRKGKKINSFIRGRGKKTIKIPNPSLKPKMTKEDKELRRILRNAFNEECWYAAGDYRIPKKEAWRHLSQGKLTEILDRVLKNYYSPWDKEHYLAVFKDLFKKEIAIVKRGNGEKNEKT